MKTRSSSHKIHETGDRAEASTSAVTPLDRPTPALPLRVQIPAVEMQDAAPGVARPPRRRHGEIPRKLTWREGRNATRAFIEQKCATFHCGSLDQVCRHCGAKFFELESCNRQGVRLNCCKDGSYAAPSLSDCPRSLSRLYTGTDSASIQFRNQIRVLNSLFAMASFKTSGHIVENLGRGHWSFSVCGEISHYTQGVPDTDNLNNPRLQHYYFLNADDALRHRRAFIGSRVIFDTLRIIETTLRRVNKYVNAYVTMGEVLNDVLQSGSDINAVTIGVMSNLNINTLLSRYNLPLSRSNVAAVFDRIEPPFQVDLRLYSRFNLNHSGHHNLKNLNPMADPMVYPLLFPRGDNGLCQDLVYRNRPSRRVTFKEFYRYRIQIRDCFSVLHCGGKLFQQYLVDAWVKVETNMLWWFRNNQIKFRRMELASLRRSNRNRASGDNQRRVERISFLPAAFYGGDRNKQRQYLDAMTVVARHGKPDLLITFTCNPRWVEITSNLEYQQKWEHRPDLVCRVFQIKLLEFMHDIVNKQSYGVVLNYHYVIEFQKRGLPHAHILITFIDDDKIDDSGAVDSIISAVIPDRNTHPLLYQRVAEYQLHGPCGPRNPRALCMKNNRCVKNYPQNYAKATKLGAGHNGRPIYKRPNDGRTILVPGTNMAVTNRNIVPYNDFALSKYACHINFEVVGSVRSVKYLYKYLSKRTGLGEGSCARQVDEIKHYLDNRYVSSMEAAWRLLGFRMSDRSQAVLVLPVHLQGENVASDDQLNDDLEIAGCGSAASSKLEAWFALNRSSPEARKYRYVEIPEHYTWDGKTGRWVIRKQVAKMIGGIAEVGRLAGQMEKYYLRILLCHVPGATSYEDLRTVDGVVLGTFQEACNRLNYLKKIDEYDLCLGEAINMRHPKKLRGLFALICCVAVYEGRAGISKLWQRYSRYLIEDFVRGGMTVRASLLAVERLLQNLVVHNHDNPLAMLAISVTDVLEDNERHYGDNNEPNNNDDNDSNRQQNREIFDPGLLNIDQKKVFRRVILSISRLTGIAVPDEILRSLGDDFAENLANQQESVFYVDGAAGSGKTYLFNMLLTVVREIFGKGTVAVAWTDVAASLLVGGQRARRVFQLPNTLSNRSRARWPLQDQISIEHVALIVWDEASMTPKFAVDAVDRYLRLVYNSPETPMGGRVVLFGGDFRQLLPVLKNGNESDIIHNTIKYSRLWPQITKLQLSQNMRADRVPLVHRECNTFPNWLVQLGEGHISHVKLPKEKAAPLDLIDVPTDILSTSYNDLITFVYGDDFISADVGSKAILCTTEAAVDKINFEILLRLPEESKIYISVDTCKGLRGHDIHIPLDVLNSINLPSLPPHELYLKVGAVVVLLRNVDVEQGLCNGVRLRVVMLNQHIIECEVLTGNGAGKTLWLPRVKMTANEPYLTYKLIRFQFPVKLAFAVTINASQGQTLTKVGVYLNRPCCTHGQLYLAFSRVGGIEQLRVFVENGLRQGTFKFRGRRVFTRNVVFCSVLTDHITDDNDQDSDNDHDNDCNSDHDRDCDSDRDRDRDTDRDHANDRRPRRRPR